MNLDEQVATTTISNEPGRSWADAFRRARQCAINSLSSRLSSDRKPQLADGSRFILRERNSDFDKSEFSHPLYEAAMPMTLSNWYAPVAVINAADIQRKNTQPREGDSSGSVSQWRWYSAPKHSSGSIIA